MFRRSLAQLASATNRALWKDLEGRFLAPLVPARGLKTTSTDRALFNVQDEEDFTERVLKSSTPVVVDFHAQ